MSVIEIHGSTDRRSLIKRFERKSKHDAIRELVDWLEINWRRIDQLEGENKALAAQQAAVPDVLERARRHLSNAIEDVESERAMPALASLREASYYLALLAAPAAPQQGKPDINAMVNRFLAWPLPADVCADPCATMPCLPNRYGTNLLTASQAKAMFEYVLATLATPQMAVPEGYVLMPKSLTAENGAKGLLIGEFRIQHEVNCSGCYFDEADPECEVCGGEVQYTEWVDVDWDTIKTIYAKAVAGLAADSGEASA
jgi:hypothetical protein